MVRRRSISTLSLALTLLAGASVVSCTRGGVGAKACEQSELAELAKRLDEAEADARVFMVAEGLLEACEGLPKTTRYALQAGIAPNMEARRKLELPGPDDAARQVLKGKLCADPEGLDERLEGSLVGDYAVVAYRHCELDRYELMSEEEAAFFSGVGWLTWTTHAMLVEDKTPAPVAKSISRAMMLFERAEFGPRLIMPLTGQRLVELPRASPIPEGVPIYISSQELEFQEQQLATLDEGVLPSMVVNNHLIAPLYDRLEVEAEKLMQIAERRGEEPELRALLVVDASVPFATVVDVMYTAGRAKFSEYAMVVQTIFPIKRAIRLAPPRWGMGAAPPSMKVMIAEDGLYVRAAGEEEPRFFAKSDANASGAAAYDLAKLGQLAVAFEAEHGEESQVVVTAENTITYEVLMATYAALLGPKCDQSRPETCVFAHLVLEAGAG